MNVLVTGGAGFIGSHLVEELIKRKNNVFVQDNISTGSMENIKHLKRKIRFFKGGINTKLKWNKVDVVYHLAAKRSVPTSFKEPHEFFKVNIDGTWDVFTKYNEARIVNISSSSASQCLSPYAISKRTAEHLARLFPNTVSLRLFNVFGERQADCGVVVPEFTKSMLQGKQPTIYGDGEQTRDFTYVKDVVNKIIEYGQGKKTKFDGTTNIGYGKSHTVNELYDKIAKILKFEGKPVYTEQRQGDARFSQAQNGMKNPTYGFEKGLKRTIKWIDKMKPYGDK